MAKNDKTHYQDRSTNDSKHPIDRAILGALSSGPMQAGLLMKKVIDSTKLAKALYYRRLAVLRDDTKEIVYAQSKREKYYALFEHASRLAPYLKKRGDLEQYVIASARELRDYMMNKAAYDTRNPDINSNIHVKFSMFIDAVAMLRDAHPGLPKFELPDYEPGDGSDYEEMIGEKWHAIRAYHRHVLKVLEFFNQ